MTRLELDSYIDLYESIPEDQWIVGRYCNEDGKKCALGHLGMEKSKLISEVPLAANLHSYFNENNLDIATINDGLFYPMFKKLNSPKQRVLAALNYLKDLKNNDY